MRKLAVIIIMCGIFFMASYANATIEVNGDMSDWGVTPGAYGASDWVPDNGAISKEEDQDSSGYYGYLGPGYGGQPFDAEAIYSIRENGYVYGAIVTGHPVDGYTGASGIHYCPGDIFFNFGAGMQYGLKTTGPNAGELYKNPLWNTSPFWGGVSDPTNMQDGAGVDIGPVTKFVYLHTYPGSGDSDHWVMELQIPESYFGSDFDKGGIIHWTETCGNDAIDLKIPAHTPEPATLSLLGLGLFGFIRLRKKQ